jgi:hypothetical protein
MLALGAHLEGLMNETNHLNPVASHAFIYLLLIISMLLFFVGCGRTNKNKYGEDAFIVTHSPNPSNIHKSEYFPKPYYPYTWYYKTTIKNISDRDLKIIWFESYVESNQAWYASNVLNRTLRNDVFLKWYGDNEGNKAKEWFGPGETRICEINWHGSDDPKGYRMKWAYIAIDKYGNDYYSEAIIESTPINNGT